MWDLEKQTPKRMSCARDDWALEGWERVAGGGWQRRQIPLQACPVEETWKEGRQLGREEPEPAVQFSENASKQILGVEIVHQRRPHFSTCLPAKLGHWPGAAT